MIWIPALLGAMSATMARIMAKNVAEVSDDPAQGTMASSNQRTGNS